MNLSYSPTPEYTFVVLPSTAGEEYAFEFKTRYIAERTLEDTIVGSALLLNAFQYVCVETYSDVFLEASEVNSDFENDPDKDVVGLFKVYCEFIHRYPSASIINIIPMDMSGTFGFVVANHM